MRPAYSLTATEFENLTFDLLRLSGFANLTWRTPGADEGRDIEAYFFSTDPSGHSDSQKWYVECKRYADSVDWPTIWKKLSYADVHGADVFLLSTTSMPSPQAENQIASWNLAGRRPKIRVWRGYDFEHLLRLNGVLALKYGLRDPGSAFDHNFGTLSSLVTKAVQAAYVSSSLGLSPAKALEAAAALSELLTMRIAEVARDGRFQRGGHTESSALYPWVSTGFAVSGCSDTSVRALLAYLRYVTSAEQIEFKLADDQTPLLIMPGKIKVSAAAWLALTSLEPWIGMQITLSPDRDRIALAPEES